MFVEVQSRLDLSPHLYLYCSCYFRIICPFFSFLYIKMQLNINIQYQMKVISFHLPWLGQIILFLILYIN